MFTRSAFGWLSDRFGETRVLTVLCALFALASLLDFDLVVTLYAYRLAGGSGVAAAVAGGQAAAHIAAVTLSLLGGLLWKSVGPEATFLTGFAICVAAGLCAHRLGPKPGASNVAAGPAVPG